MNKVWVNTLKKLLDQREISSSSIPKTVREKLELWGIQTGAIRVIRKGRGSVYKVENSTVIENNIGTDSENKLEPKSLRADNLSKYRDTKTGESRHHTTYYLAKAIGSSVTWKSIEGTVNLTEITKQLGCFSIPVGENEKAGIKSDYPLLLVENQALFDYVSWIDPNWRGILLYYAGNISDRLLSWLVNTKFSKITIFPDYDGIGLNNYSRLKDEIPTSNWYWVEGWNTALTRYGSDLLWQKEEQRKQVDTLSKRWNSESYPDIQLKELINQMRIEGKMLEQEWVLI